MQPAIHGDDLPGRFAQALRDEKKIRFRLIRRCDGGFRERAIGVKLREFFHERFRRFVVRVRNDCISRASR